MLQELFNNKKLEYVYVIHGRNIASSMTISPNIENLRFLYVDNYVDRVDITLDVSNEYPAKLQVY